MSKLLLLPFVSSNNKRVLQVRWLRKFALLCSACQQVFPFLFSYTNGKQLQTVVKWPFSETRVILLAGPLFCSVELGAKEGARGEIYRAGKSLDFAKLFQLAKLEKRARTFE